MHHTAQAQLYDYRVLVHAISSFLLAHCWFLAWLDDALAVCMMLMMVMNVNGSSHHNYGDNFFVIILHFIILAHILIETFVIVYYITS